MTKAEAIAIFGETQTDLAQALKVSRQLISWLPDDLPERYADRVLGAAVRLGKLPEQYCQCGGAARVTE